MDMTSAIEKGFQEEFCRLLETQRVVHAGIDRLSEEDALELGRAAARSALAPLIWSAALGERWDVPRASAFLRVSRQALYKRVRNGSALGIPGHGTTWFPVWQFDPRTSIIRSVTSSVIKTFRDADPDIDPLVIGAWATKENRLLAGESPAGWLAEGGADEAVIAAARRAAEGLAA